MNRYRALLVGEAPKACGCAPLRGRVGNALIVASGLSRAEFDRVFVRTNVFTVPQQSHGKGASFPMTAARVEAVRLQRRCRARVVVLLGKRVASAFGIDPTYFEKSKIHSCDVFVVPHPSGINRWFNEANNRVRFSRFMRSIVAMIKNDDGRHDDDKRKRIVKRKASNLSAKHKAAVAAGVKAWWDKRRAEKSKEPRES